MSGIDFSNETIKNTEVRTSKYLTPGIHAVKLVNVETGLSANKGTPYIRLFVEDKEGAGQSFDLYLSTTAGKTGQTAMNISKAKIFEIAVAVLGGEEKAKLLLSNNGTEELVAKMNTNLTNKFFTLKVNGEEIQTPKGTFVKAVLGSGRFAEATGTTPTKVFYDPEKNIKRLTTIPTPKEEVSAVINGSVYL